MTLCYNEDQSELTVTVHCCKVCSSGMYIHVPTRESPSWHYIGTKFLLVALKVGVVSSYVGVVIYCTTSFAGIESNGQEWFIGSLCETVSPTKKQIGKQFNEDYNYHNFDTCIVQQRFRTKTIFKDLNPTYEETFTFTGLMKDSLEKKKLWYNTSG